MNVHIIERFDKIFDKILNQLDPDIYISKNASSQLETFINIVAKMIVEKADELTILGEKKTVTPRAIDTAVSIVLPGEISRHAVRIGNKAVNNHKMDPLYFKKDGVDIVGDVPVKKTHNIIKHIARDLKISKGASIYLAAVLDYLLQEILELSFFTLEEGDERTIDTRNLYLAITNDEEFDFLASEMRWEIVGGGVIPYIQAELEYKPKKKKGNKKGNKKK